MQGGRGGVPLLVWLTGQRVVCVGAGPVAAEKVLPLVEAGAVVEVVAPDAVDVLRQAADDGKLVWHRRSFEGTDLDGAVLVLAATADGAVNARVAAAATERSTLCVRVDRSPRHLPSGTAAFLATLRRGPLLLAVSTSGCAPALSRRIRDELAGRYGPEYGELAELLGALREDPQVRAALSGLPPAERRARWRSTLDADTLDLIRNGHVTTAKEVVTACLCSSSD